MVLSHADLVALGGIEEGFVRVIRSGECKNSPKNAFVEDFVIDLLARADLRGRIEETAHLPALPDGISAIEISHAISHGKVGAANGALVIDGDKAPFAAFIEFATTKGALVRTIGLYFAQKA